MNHNELKNFLEKNDRFAKNNSIKLIEVSEGYAKTSMKINDNHLNAANVVHGGAIFTLADFAFAAASNSHGNIALAVNVDISFLSAATIGTLYAEAREISKNKKLSSYRVDIKDENGTIIAVFQGMVYIKSQTLV
jgi:acyl-CoA thioesterase